VNTVADAMKTLLCAAFTTNVNRMSFHTGDPGVNGANDSGVTHATVAWQGETGGINQATVTVNLSGTYTHVGLWKDGTFRMGIPCDISYVSTVSITVLLTHNAVSQ